MTCRSVNVLAPNLNRLRSLSAHLNDRLEVRYDRTLRAARADIGGNCDPGNKAHARRLRKWLNDWGCRIGYPDDDQSDPFVNSLDTWWNGNRWRLPAQERRLSQLSDAELGAVAAAYGELRPMTASIRPKNSVRTSFGPTATSKVLYFIRPNAVTAWDEQIAGHVGCDRSAQGFLAHLVECRGWATRIVAEARDAGILERDVGPELGRPDSSVAKLIDEYLYETITRRWRPE